MTYRIKEGMLVHPFSDLSGVVIFDTITTLVTSLACSPERMRAILKNDGELTSEEYAVLEELLAKELIEVYV